MSYDERLYVTPKKPAGIILEWLVFWLSDWLGLFDTAVGIITLTAYYPATQEWLLESYYQWRADK